MVVGELTRSGSRGNKSRCGNSSLKRQETWFTSVIVVILDTSRSRNTEERRGSSCKHDDVPSIYVTITVEGHSGSYYRDHLLFFPPPSRVGTTERRRSYPGGGYSLDSFPTSLRIIRTTDESHLKGGILILNPSPYRGVKRTVTNWSCLQDGVPLPQPLTLCDHQTGRFPLWHRDLTLNPPLFRECKNRREPVLCHGHHLKDIVPRPPPSPFV